MARDRNIKPINSSSALFSASWSRWTMQINVNLKGSQVGRRCDWPAPKIEICGRMLFMTTSGTDAQGKSVLTWKRLQYSNRA